MLNKEIFKPKLGTWFPKIEPFFETLEPIYTKLKKESEKGKKIFPASKDTFKAFQLTDYDNLKAVVVGLSPYHTYGKNREIVADGIALSCSYSGENLAPSLKNWYSAIKKEFDADDLLEEPNLSYLCQQGVLMTNLALTTEYQLPGNHVDLWEPFMKALFTEVISVTGVPVIMLGEKAEIVEKWLAPMQWSFKISHPASASYSGGEWDSEGVFKKVKKIVEQNNNFTLDWYLTDVPF